MRTNLIKQGARIPKPETNSIGPAHIRSPILEDALPAPVLPALRSALRRARSWAIPRNWSFRDWFQEIEQVGTEAACQATYDYDLRSNFPVEAFVHNRVLGRVLSCYRREWSFGARFCNADPRARNDESNEPGKEPESEPCAAPLAFQEDLNEAVEQLAEAQRWVIVQIFWNGCTETELARELKLSQRAVSKRKQAALKHLHERFEREAPGSVTQSPAKKIKPEVLSLATSCNNITRGPD